MCTRKSIKSLFVYGTVLFLGSCVVRPTPASIQPIPEVFEAQITPDKKSPPDKTAQRGLASVYSDKFQGKKTASGKIFNQRLSTAAHRTLPFDTKVKVTNPETSLSIVVEINDRGPHVKGRIIDLSSSAAKKLGMKVKCTALVLVEVVETPAA